ncbi:hypothetical protein AAKU67_003973 [Oxalobacteraceae bacterium GrIS 2.11]
MPLDAYPEQVVPLDAYAEGAQGLVSRRCNRPSNNHTSPDIAKMAFNIIRDRYVDFGPTLACEKLRECHGITLAKETIRARLIMRHAKDSSGG